MWNNWVLIILCYIIVVYGQYQTPRPSTDIIKSDGYEVEDHHVYTSDGYILSLHRIPNHNYKRPVKTVLIQHGLFGSSADFLLGGKENGLAYVMADAGYDVWLGNFRGNVYSRRNIKLKPHEPQFWDFEWHQFGTIDLPAMIDYILEATAEKKIEFIGHSQATTAFLVMASEKSQYNAKVHLAHLMSPMAFMWDTSSLFFRELTALLAGNETVQNLIGEAEFIPVYGLDDMLIYDDCKKYAENQYICDSPFFLMYGLNTRNLNADLLQDLIKRNPAGGSANQLIHYAQEILSKRFCKFDYGEKENLKRYGSRNPPDYDLSRVTTKIALYFSEFDELNSYKNVLELKSKLPNVVDFSKIGFKWNSLDFLWGRYVKDVVYKKLLYNIRKVRFSLYGLECDL